MNTNATLSELSYKLTEDVLQAKSLLMSTDALINYNDYVIGVEANNGLLIYEALLFNVEMLSGEPLQVGTEGILSSIGNKIKDTAIKIKEFIERIIIKILVILASFRDRIRNGFVYALMGTSHSSGGGGGIARSNYNLNKKEKDYIKDIYVEEEFLKYYKQVVDNAYDLPDERIRKAVVRGELYRKNIATKAYDLHIEKATGRFKSLVFPTLHSKYSGTPIITLLKDMFISNTSFIKAIEDQLVVEKELLEGMGQAVTSDFTNGEDKAVHAMTNWLKSHPLFDNIENERYDYLTRRNVNTNSLLTNLITSTTGIVFSIEGILNANDFSPSVKLTFKQLLDLCTVSNNFKVNMIPKPSDSSVKKFDDMDDVFKNVSINGFKSLIKDLRECESVLTTSFNKIEKTMKEIRKIDRGIKLLNTDSPDFDIQQERYISFSKFFLTRITQLSLLVTLSNSKLKIVEEYNDIITLIEPFILMGVVADKPEVLKTL